MTGKIKHPALDALRSKTKRAKVVSVEDAVKLVYTGDTIATGGFVGIGFAEEIAVALEKRFLETNEPKDLTLVYAAGQGDGKERGLNHFGHEGMIKRVVGGHWGLAPKLQKLAVKGKIEAYNFPQGVISHMFRDIAAHKPRTITSVGVDTFVDPRRNGGKINETTRDDLVEIIEFDGKEYLSYKTFPIDVAIIRGTTGDTDGNITMEKEALTLEVLAIAQAVRNSGGIVIVQVERIAESGTLNARQVKIPGILVDCVVECSDINKYHWQTFGVQYDPSFSCETKIPLSAIEPMPLNERKIICRRSALELSMNDVVNLGIGMPEGVAKVSAEEQILDFFTLTAEPGVIGGVPAGGLSFGAATNTDAIVDQPSQFDFYDGGGLDTACLGLAQADKEGNLNVSKFGTKLAGAGGFINISQNAKKVVFAGTFTASGLKVSIKDGKLTIDQEGKVKKFVDEVEHRTFSGRYAVKNKQPVYYVTERCVFKLTENGMELIEIAPGIDIEKDILAQMDFKPVINGEPKLMDKRIFKDEPMHLNDDFFSIPLEERFTYTEEENVFFVNFEGLYIKDKEQIDRIKQIVTETCKPLKKRVYTIVNYDNFTIVPDLVDDYSDMVKSVTNEYYESVSRFTSNAFWRIQLGEALRNRYSPWNS